MFERQPLIKFLHKYLCCYNEHIDKFSLKIWRLHIGCWFLYLSTTGSFSMTLMRSHGSTILLLCCIDPLPRVPDYWVIA
jgi:hypothetical protein